MNETTPPKAVTEMRAMAYAAPESMPKELRTKLVAGQGPLREIFAYIDVLEAECIQLKRELGKKVSPE